MLYFFFFLINFSHLSFLLVFFISYDCFMLTLKGFVTLVGYVLNVTSRV